MDRESIHDIVHKHWVALGLLEKHSRIIMTWELSRFGSMQRMNIDIDTLEAFHTVLNKHHNSNLLHTFHPFSDTTVQKKPAFID